MARVSQWADVEIGQQWRARDRRENRRLVEVDGFTQDGVLVTGVESRRSSIVAKHYFHSRYERVEG